MAAASLLPPARTLVGLAAFRAENHIIDLDNPIAYISEHFNPKGNTATHDALMLGLRDYAKKSGFKKAIIGLVAVLTAVVAVLAAEASRTKSLALPCPPQFQPTQSRRQPRRSPIILALNTTKLPSPTQWSLNPHWDLRWTCHDATEENIQARARGLSSWPCRIS